MLKGRDSIFIRSVFALADAVREALEKVVELPRNIKQACLLSLDMAAAT